MQFKREKVTLDLIEKEMMPLLKKHYLEIAAFQDIPMNPNIENYLKLENNGLLRCFTARDEAEENSLVGYAVFFVQTNIHYSDSLQAMQDVIYLEKSKRGLGLGKGFIDWCDFQLKEEGVQVVHHHVKEKHNFGAMLESLGYQLVDLIFARRLDK